MLEIFDVNPFVEAIFYYFGRANDKCIKKRLEKLIYLHPEQEEAFKAAAEPAVMLEKILDSKLNVDDTLIIKYFKVFEDISLSYPSESCLASMMVFCPFLKCFEYSTDDLYKYLRECSIDERMDSFCLSLNPIGEPFYYHYENKIREFSERLENSQFPLEVKWKIQSAAFDYQTHIEELLSLIIPAVKLIKNEAGQFKTFLNGFRSLYSGNNAQHLLESNFKCKFEPVDVIKVMPMLLGFDNKIASFVSRLSPLNTDKSNCSNTNNDAHIGKIFLGVGCHLISKSPEEDIPLLCEHLKALADNTRLEILFYLCSHRVYGQELCNRFNLHHSTISHHITKLLTAGFVTAEPVGTQTYYTADKEGIQKLIDAFAEKIK